MTARMALMWLLMGIAMLVFVIVMGVYTMGRVDSMATITVVDTQYVYYSEVKELHADAVRVMWMALGLGVVAGFFITQGVIALLRK